MACVTAVPQPGMEPALPALQPYVNLWTAREVPANTILD